MKAIYMVYDKVSNSVIGNPILESADPAAIRSFHDALAQQGSLLALHPTDYELRRLGELDDNGDIRVPIDGPHTVATGAQWAASLTPTLEGSTK